MAIKQVETVRHTRFVRSLLMRGAPRSAIDLQKRRAIDIVPTAIQSKELQRSAIKDL